jgi:hypothetical protein
VRLKTPRQRRPKLTPSTLRSIAGHPSSIPLLLRSHTSIGHRRRLRQGHQRTIPTLSNLDSLPMLFITHRIGVLPPSLIRIALCPPHIVHCPHRIHTLRLKIIKRLQARWRRSPHPVVPAVLVPQEVAGIIRQAVVVPQEIHPRVYRAVRAAR